MIKVGDIYQNKQTGHIYIVEAIGYQLSISAPTKKRAVFLTAYLQRDVWASVLVEDFDKHFETVEATRDA